MARALLLLLGVLRSACRSRADLMLENAALRHQLGVLTRARRRPRVTAADRWFWVVLHRLWRRWSEVLVIVKPETVVRWHRAGFRLYWNWLSRRGRPRRPRPAAEPRALVRRLATENPTWGAPGVHGELRMLGFGVSERTVSRLMPRRAPKPESAQRWMTFLLNTVTPSPQWNLLRLLRDYVACHHDDRTHLGLAKATPAGRPQQTRSVGDAEIISLPRLGGLHHRYEWRGPA